MAKMVTLTIDEIQVEVPEGTLVVDAAKKAGVDIPVFCYHPKMEPVGMCRMCLVEIGRPVIDRATGQPVLGENGAPKIQFGPKLETACTTPVSPGMVVQGMTENAKAGREDILEFLLTSHPLDCPVCDKGGECPLQNLTMGWGPGESRYLYDEKKHLAKHVPLGELIYLDRERCIQCARCVRFQEVIADDPVIGFFNRGRSLEIISYSEPGFDSYWSGNTTDICPVGALTTADFRFRARPWELRAAASICNHCPVGCNLTLNVRREAVSGGSWVVKRVMPRQNEMVNEIWICDKGRFGYHFAALNPERLEKPLVRKNGELQPVAWEEALDVVAKRFKEAGNGLMTLAGGRLANEDLFNLGKLTQTLGGKTALYSHMAGGDLTTQIGFPQGTNFAEMSKDSAILVVGCDLEEEAPLWWLRVSQAAKRGATLIVLNMRETKLDRAAAYSLRYPFGTAPAAALALLNAISAKRPELPDGVQELARSAELKAAASAFAAAKDAVILYGSDGMGLAETQALAQACANLLLATSHVGRPNNGLLGVWPRANDQGAWELGWRPSPNLAAEMAEAQALYIVAADPVSDDPAYQPVFGTQKFVVVQDLYLSQTARLADVVLPAQSWLEREGSYTSGERRVQRFYPTLQPTLALPDRVESPSPRRAQVLTAIRPELEGPQADFAIPALIASQLEISGLTHTSASAVFTQMAAQTKAFAGLSYQKLAEVVEQWPIVGRSDMYYGGTTYENKQGLGVQLPLSDTGGSLLSWPQVADFRLPRLGAIAFPITRLYDGGSTLRTAEMLQQRIGEPYLVLSPEEAARLKVSDGGMVRLTFTETGQSVVVQARPDESLPERVVLAPRSFGLPISGPTPVELRPAS
jgi:NADH-quinone oxidoreductase subunit G